MVFIVENTFRIGLYTVLGIITPDVLGQAVCLIPAMLLGLWLGIKSSQLLNEGMVKRFVMFLLVLSGIALIVRNL